MDKILEKFFEPERWEYAIEKGIIKDIRKDQLYQLTKPEVRAEMYRLVRDGKYKVSPPHTAKIPKDTPGEFRTVYVNEPMDRVFMSIANDLLFELCPNMVHPRCKSYQKGIGCGHVVQEVSQKVIDTRSDIVGWKSDLSKYFDSVPIRFIDSVFDQVEQQHGKSAIIDVIRDYYHSDCYFDTETKSVETKYQSLKQGCAVAAFLADAVLYDIDSKMSALPGYYVRYSDDMLYIGDSHPEAMVLLVDELMKMDMKLNPKKVENLTKNRWFKFLGFSIKGSMISLSRTRIKTFQKEIESRTFKNRDITYQRALNKVNNYLYKGNRQFSWATQILPFCNVKKDLDELNTFVMDCLRAVMTGKHRLGGLGYVVDKQDGCIQRGTGRNVTANRTKTPARLDGYLSIGCMYKALHTRRALYNTLAMSI